MRGMQGARMDEVNGDALTATELIRRAHARSGGDEWVDKVIERIGRDHLVIKAMFRLGEGIATAMERVHAEMDAETNEWHGSPLVAAVIASLSRALTSYEHSAREEGGDNVAALLDAALIIGRELGLNDAEVDKRRAELAAVAPAAEVKS